MNGISAAQQETPPDQQAAAATQYSVAPPGSDSVVTPGNKPIAIFVALVSFTFRDSTDVGAKGGDLIPLATSVFRDFAFPFEVASVLLLAAMVGAIVLVKRDEE